MLIDTKHIADNNFVLVRAHWHILYAA